MESPFFILFRCGSNALLRSASAGTSSPRSLLDLQYALPRIAFLAKSPRPWSPSILFLCFPSVFQQTTCSPSDPVYVRLHSSQRNVPISAAAFSLLGVHGMLTRLFIFNGIASPQAQPSCTIQTTTTPTTTHRNMTTTTKVSIWNIHSVEAAFRSDHRVPPSVNNFARGVPSMEERGGGGRVPPQTFLTLYGEHVEQ